MSSWGCTKCVKKIISLILSLAICAAMLPAAFAANEDLVFRDARSDFAAEFADSKIVDAQALGEDKIAALTDDGDLWLHSDEFGTFKKVAEDVAAFDGSYYALAYIKKDGSLWIDDEDVRPADGVTSETENGYKKVMENVVSVSYDRDFGIAIDTDGKAWFWGTEVAEMWVPFDYEDVPSGYTETGVWGTSVVKPYNFMDDVKEIVVDGAMLILTNNGDLYAVGSNINCSLGIGIEDETYYTKEPAFVTNRVKEIVRSSLHKFVLKTDGSLWGWGTSEVRVDDFNSSAPIMLADDAKDAEVFSRYPAIVKTDGSLSFDHPYHMLKFSGVESIQSYSNIMLVILGNGTLLEMGGEVGKPEGEFAYADIILLAGPDWSMEDMEAPTQEETPPATTATAKPTASKVLVNGKEVAFDAYNINDNNYFKLRDIALQLSGTEKQFEVEWDETNDAILLTSGMPYTAVGGEMAAAGTESRKAELTQSAVILDGAEASFTAYNILDNNYFKLRDLGQAFDFDVSWDEASQTITIDTSASYTPD